MRIVTNGIVHDEMDRGASIAAECGKARSTHWPTFEHHFAIKFPRRCAYCGRIDGVQLHHISPFHLHPELELDENNVIWLCENAPEDHHLHIGHLGNFRTSFNPNVREDCKKHLAEINARPMKDLR